MKAPSLPKTLLIALSTVILLALPSCVDPGYGYYGGTSYSVLPYGYSTVHVSGVPYYYYGNSWYRRSSGRYIRCSRPHGYHGTIGRHSSRHHGTIGRHSSRHHGITRLPRGYRSHNIGGTRYYSHGNTWYRRSGNIYHVTPRPHHSKTPSKYHSSPSYRSGPSYRHSPSTHSGSSYRSNSSHRSSPSYRPSSTHHSSRYQNLTRSHTRKSVTPTRTSTHRPTKSTYTPRSSTHRTATPRNHRHTSKPQAKPKRSKKAHPLSKPVKTR